MIPAHHAVSIEVQADFAGGVPGDKLSRSPPFVALHDSEALPRSPL